ncbi:hypothetical protein DWV83_13640 [Coprobacillus sp. AF13-15]|jgi:hypothetical protein|uniref:sublancin family glycopeptide n=1 Tax=Faecalibacillus TaxID=2678885 RepID=UPI000E53A390|nr:MULTISPECIES: sublancin family glycopeptide [Faecalibacillus]RGG31697.1 hypothetical protein DWY19_04965 [Coprobacillus sp. AF24-1LB]RHQ83911.1 hypothetical protein DWX89_09720 [Coprobacillus sp. AF21-8LB]RHS03042.1 hypothetical protein DWV95_15100 [Coprobacillus sp. AF13-4LB]RHS11135.1 hypothetical protein DWV86_14225 [Coprobacillus sp. AF13-25]RHS11918.1 hypothetical protein DWV83_15435 [Coprobacillus sp. AF13-15]
MSKQLLNEVFKEETSEQLLSEVSGGLTQKQCKQVWWACQTHQVVPCGNGTSACDVYKKYCK